MRRQGALETGIALSLSTISPAAAAIPETVPPPALSTAMAPPLPFRDRADAILGILRGGPVPGGLFTPAFTAEIPDERLGRIAADLRRQFGEPRSVLALRPLGDGGAALHIRYARAEVRFRFALEMSGKRRIAGFWITASLAPEASLEAAVAALAALPGRSALALTRLDDGQRLAAVRADRPLAAGSIFKLVILAELSRAVSAGEMRWDDRAARNITPTGKQSATVRDLAERMIAVSDNQAADSLAAFVGRDRLEAMMTRLRVADPALNRPFLTVRELFTLKSAAGAPVADRWAGASEAERRRMLDSDVAAIPWSAIERGLFQDGRPARIDSIEWFFTPDDLVRILAWFHRQGDAESRRILR